MPRKKITVKPLNKKMPKTTGIMLTGSCGHSYKERFTLPYHVSGDVSNQTLRALSELKTVILKDALRSECKDCVARQDIEISKGRTDMVEDFIALNEFSFPRMDNTPRMAAFAESVRQDTIYRNIIRLSEEIQNSFNKDYLINTLVVEAFKKNWQIDFDQKVKPSAEILTLAKKYKKFQVDFLNMDPSKNAPILGLAFWLILREHFEKHRRYRENRSKIWISAHRRYFDYARSTFSDPDIHSSSILSALLVANIQTWENLDDAWNAFKALSQRDSNDFSDFISKETENGASLKDTISGVQVVRALRG